MFPWFSLSHDLSQAQTCRKNVREENLRSFRDLNKSSSSEMAAANIQFLRMPQHMKCSTGELNCHVAELPVQIALNQSVLLFQQTRTLWMRLKTQEDDELKEGVQ